jgi:hypothetical protein
MYISINSPRREYGISLTKSGTSLNLDKFTDLCRQIQNSLRRLKGPTYESILYECRYNKHSGSEGDGAIFRIELKII